MFLFTIEINSSHTSVACKNNATHGILEFSSRLINGMSAIKNLAHLDVVYKPKVQTVQYNH